MTTAAKRILVVDDDEALLETTRATLEKEGYEVHLHQSVFGAVSMARRISPDLILLDINMPAMSGEELVALLREGGASTCKQIVFYSSNDESSLRYLTLHYGVRGYVCKGDPGQLKLRVSRYLAMGKS